MRGNTARLALLWLPWPLVMLAVTVLALKSGGVRVALFALAPLAYILLAGYLAASMSTLSLVLLAGADLDGDRFCAGRARPTPTRACALPYLPCST